jgi:hypothetical protein
MILQKYAAFLNVHFCKMQNNNMMDAGTGGQYWRQDVKTRTEKLRFQWQVLMNTVLSGPTKDGYSFKR